MLTWVFRFGGFLIMAVGIALVLRPLVVLADVIPFAGSIASVGVAIIAFLVAGAFSIFVIGIAWLFYRPLLAIVLFVLGGLLIFAVVRYLKRDKASATELPSDGIPTVG